MARFKRIRNEEDEQRRNIPTHSQVNEKMQNSFSSTVGGGLSDAVAEAVMSGFRVIIAMVALVIVLWFLTTLN